MTPTFRAGPNVSARTVGPAQLHGGEVATSVQVADGLLTHSKRHREGFDMVKLSWLAIPVALALGCGSVWVANAQAPGSSYAVYCRGPLSTFRTEGGKVIRTPFKWAKQAATKENPGAGECAWADGTPQGIEAKPGDGGTLVGNLGPFDSMPVGTIGKVCVSKANSDANNDFIVREILRQLGHETAPFHRPPFSAAGCSA